MQATAPAAVAAPARVWIAVSHLQNTGKQVIVSPDVIEVVLLLAIVELDSFVDDRSPFWDSATPEGELDYHSSCCHWVYHLSRGVEHTRIA